MNKIVSAFPNLSRYLAFAIGFSSLGAEFDRLEAQVFNPSAAQATNPSALSTPTTSVQQRLGLPRSQLGNPSGQQLGMGSGAGAATATPRYIRGSRSRQDYVGSSRTDLKGFVGTEQAIGVGRVTPAASTFKLETAKVAKGNQPLPPQPKKGIYYPRLEVDFDLPAGQELNPPKGVEVPAGSEIQTRVSRIGGTNVRVSLQGKTAIIKGTVDSRRSAELIGQLLSFEPGIDSVRNEASIQ